MDTVGKGNGRGDKNSLVDLLGCLDSGPITEKRAPCSSIGEYEKADPTVMAKLEIDNKGQARNSINNIMIIMSNDNKWANRLSFNSFSHTVMLDDQQLADTAITEFRIDIGQRYRIETGKSKIWAVADFVAQRNTINPLTDYLDSLRWDGNKRFSTWIIQALGAEDTSINRVMSRKWCIGAVARAYSPGCKVDSLILLVGPQGVGKSKALRFLAGDEWFCDTEITLGNKDAFMQVGEAWIYELAEMTSLHKTRRERVKSFLSSATDAYRPPYGRIVSRIPRHTIFAASTNEETPLDDPTGSRRFWPIATPGPLDGDWLEKNRDQIWAEAVEAYKSGEIWHLDDADELERQKVSRDFEQTDPWATHIESWAENHNEFTIRNCLEEALQIAPHRQGREHQNRVGAILRRLGYSKRKARRGEAHGDSRPWLWYRANEAARADA